MISTRPYLLRAIYQWTVDNELTPQLLVDASYPDVVIVRLGDSPDVERVRAHPSCRTKSGLRVSHSHYGVFARPAF